MVQKYCNSRKQILERGRRNREIYRRKSKRSNKIIRERIETRREGITLEREDICF